MKLATILQERGRQTLLYRWWRERRRRRKQIRAITEWKGSGRPAPPPHVIKQMIVRTYGRKYRLPILVETGTRFGDMLLGVQNDFERIYSIELVPELVSKARARFAPSAHIEIIQGDSGRELKSLLERIDRPALFWLDSHFGDAGTYRPERETPIMTELTHILDAPDLGHVILIDDARYFGTKRAYPSLDDLRSLIQRRRAAEIRVRYDAIRITPHIRRSSGAAQTAKDLPLSRWISVDG